MIISRTPIRISFVGGGTDISNFYRQYGGEVISTAIDKYISVCITREQNSQITINTPDRHETVSDPDQIQHSLIREAVRKTFPPASGGVRGGDSEGVAEWLGGVRGGWTIHHSYLRCSLTRLWIGIVKCINRRTAQCAVRLSGNRNTHRNPRASSV